MRAVAVVLEPPILCQTRFDPSGSPAMMLRRLLLAGMLAVAAWTAPAQETRPTDGEVQAELQPAVALAHRVERMKRA